MGRPYSVLCKLAILIGLSPMLLSAKVLSDGIHPVPLQMAQAQAPRKVEADGLSKQGNEQFNTGQFAAAIRSWQQAN